MKKKRNGMWRAKENKECGTASLFMSHTGGMSKMPLNTK
jgi:hypothetical protein